MAKCYSVFQSKFCVDDGDLSYENLTGAVNQDVGKTAFHIFHFFIICELLGLLEKDARMVYL